MSDEANGAEQRAVEYDVGARLRVARDTQGLRVATVAEALNLPAEVIHALENDDYDALGAPVYVRGYLRKYARYLDLPGDELVAAYEQIATAQDPELQAHFASGVPQREGRRWLAAALTLLIIVVIGVAAYFAWHYLRHGQETTSIPPAAAASATPALIQGAAMATGGQALVASAAATTAEGRAMPAMASPSSPSEQPQSSSADRKNSPAPASQSLLTLHIRSTSWIEVRAADHTRLYYDLARTGSVLNFSGAHGALTVLVGNVQGVDVEVNGRAYSIPKSDRSGNTAQFSIAATAPAGADQSG